ncbi:MMPL family transporter [Subtercola boreus]|uniref:MMPL family transporter n=1 Tax=Subtercola boreus TaxID=120213 RepID=UPI001C0EB1B7|nr:MMPL family transporter [Subtercola boreus]
MAVLLYRIGAFAARRHFVVMAVWLLIVAAALIGAKVFDGQMSQSVEIPGTQSQTAIDMLGSRFPAANGAGSKVIYVAPEGQSIRSFETQVTDAATRLATLENVAGVTNPFQATGSTEAVAAAAAEIAADNSMAYISVNYSVPASELTDADAEAIKADGDASATSGLTVAYAGVKATEAADNSQEAVGLLIALIILAITIGSLLAAGMPLITAAVGVAISTASITIFADFVTISSTAPILASMLGLAVGIDYALFIVSRHRSQLVAGIPPRESIAIATSTAGSAVVFAGITVIIALIGLSVVQIPFLSVMGLGAAFGVLLAIVVSVTLLPALLGLLNTTLIPKPSSRAAKRERELLGPDHAGRPTMGRRWVNLVTRRPLITVIVVPLALLVVALPALGLKLTIPDAGYDAPGSQGRIAYDLLTTGYGPGFNGPLLVTADISHTTDIQGALDALSKQFTGLDDVTAVSPAIPNQALDMAIVSLTPASAPDSDATKALVQTLRNDAPAFSRANGFSYMVTGQTAVSIDISDRLGGALLPFALVVVGLCLVLLTMVFRSLAVPITATLGFLLSVGASLGVVTAIFNWGWLAEPLSVQKVGPVISFMPILVMAVLFGLAMDYQVFLVSRMREEFSRTGHARDSVLDGFSAAARVVTAAALIMFSVFASFVPGGGAVLQPLAGALAIGVLIDAFLVRMTLIPAIMAMLGTKAWYLPAWLGRHLPNVDIEGEKVHELIAARDWRPAGAEGAAVAGGAEGAVGAEGSAGAEGKAVAGGADAGFGPTSLASATAEPATSEPATAAPATPNGTAAVSTAPVPVTREAVAAGKRAARAASKAADRDARRSMRMPPPPPAPISAAIAAGGLALAGRQPLDLEVAAGGLALVVESVGAASSLAPDVAAAALLAVVTGRLTPEGGHLSVLGHPQPFEAAAVRRRSRLVSAVETIDEPLTVGEYLLGEVRLDARRGHRARQLAAVARHLRVLEGVVTDAVPTQAEPPTPLTELGLPARWCLDVALALASSAEVIAVDARQLDPALAAVLVAAITAEARPSTTLIVAMPAGAMPAGAVPPGSHTGSHAAGARPTTVIHLAPELTDQGALV